MSSLFYNRFIFGDVDTADYGIRVSGVNTFAGSERDMEELEPIGRSGSVFSDRRRFKNKVLEYECSMIKRFNEDFDVFRNRLISQAGEYQRLEDTYHPEEYRRAMLIGEITPTTTALNRDGSFYVTFSCDPRRFLKATDIWREESTKSSNNRTSHDALPAFKFKASATTATLTLNGTRLSFKNLTSGSEYIVDYEKNNLYKADGTLYGAGLNGYVRDWGAMKPGRNTWSYTNMSKLYVKERYFNL